MLQINNILRALAEAKHSLDQIIESAMDLTPVSRVNNDNNVETSPKSAAGIKELKRNGATKERVDNEERRGRSQRCGMAPAY
jgi:hypothetical protein